MKNYILLFILPLSLFQTEIQKRGKNDLQKADLKGNVKSVIESRYFEQEVVDIYQVSNNIDKQSLINLALNADTSKYRGHGNFSQYDVNGNIIEKGVNKKYNNKGQLIEYEKDYGKYLLTYNINNGHLIKTIVYNKNKGLEKCPTINTYNDDGTIAEIKWLCDIGKPQCVTCERDVYNYSDEGLEIIRYTTNSGGHLNLPYQERPMMSTLYDKHGNLLKTTDLLFNRLMGMTTSYVYDTNGDLIEKYSNNSKDVTHKYNQFIYKYVYDGNNNWIKRISIGGGYNAFFNNLYDVTIRKIKYY